MELQGKMLWARRPQHFYPSQPERRGQYMYIIHTPDHRETLKKTEWTLVILTTWIKIHRASSLKLQRKWGDE